MKVYLAGPDVFLPNPVEWAKRLKVVCNKYGLEGVFPLDAALDLKGMSKYDSAMAIYRANIEFIDDCEAVIANMTPFRGVNMDTGTAFEMGYAASKGKLIVGYTSDGREYLERVKSIYGDSLTMGEDWRDQSDMLVEDFGLIDNLMMVGAVNFIGASFEEAVRYVADHLQKR